MAKMTNSRKQGLVATSIAAVLGSTGFQANRKGNKTRAGKTKIQQIFLAMSLAAFAGSTGFSLVRTYSEALNQQSQSLAQPASTSSLTLLQAELQAQLRGYELVLKREPDNEVALEGLANTYIATDNFKEAIEPLEKLVKLNLGRSDYANLLKESKQKADGHS